MKDRKGLGQLAIVIFVVIVLAFTTFVVIQSQKIAEENAFTYSGYEPNAPDSIRKGSHEIDKLRAEIRKIRSDTSGSLFWLKLIALFVTVGGAVGGYLMGQSTTTKQRINFDDRVRVDADFQSIVTELTAESALLRATAAVKLGMILSEFPSEWHVSAERRHQLIGLTKRVLAASLAIETDEKVLKTVTMSLILHRKSKKEKGDARDLDLSNAKAVDAYWAKVDFSGSDFYLADLRKTSFRSSILHYCQFREADLRDTVFAAADCTDANFDMADLRKADLNGAQLEGAKFTNAKVFGASFSGSIFGSNPAGMLDISEQGDGSEMIEIAEWLSQ